MTVFESINQEQVLTLLRRGGLGVVPTDTIYGVVASARNKRAVARLYKLKHRERKPGTVIAADLEQLIELGLSESALASVSHLWPNPISIIIPAALELDYLDQGLGDLAVRIPDDDDLRRLLRRTGPLLTTSANHPGLPSAVDVEEAQGYFGQQVDFYVDGGDLSGRPPSTVARYSNGKLEILRHGAILPNVAEEQVV